MTLIVGCFLTMTSGKKSTSQVYSSVCLTVTIWRYVPNY